MNQIPLTPVTSSKIHSVGYDETTKTLAIRFLRKGEPSSIYRYANVTREQFQDLVLASSIGKHFAEVFKPFPSRYPYVRVEP